MSEELLINVTPQETRVAITENGVLQEFHVERTRRRGLVGNIYLGTVSRVLPGMGAAFVDIGLERTAFLHASDIADANAEADGAPRPDVHIERQLHEGQKILVQVTKDPLGSKGARLTTQLSIPSRYLVFIPDSDSLGVSQKIHDENERQRLRDLVSRYDPATLKSGGSSSSAHHGSAESVHRRGYIVRTAADGADEVGLRADMQFLHRLWASLQAQAMNATPPCVIYEDLPLLLRTIRDRSAGRAERIRIDGDEAYQEVRRFAARFTPDLLPRIEHYAASRPILDLYGIEDEVQRALQRKVELKSGGHIVIDQTEAMTTVDVNTGGFVGHRNLEETIFKTNLEAAQAIARQLRLRNLGGIIIIDFIDMQDPEHQRQILRTLEKGMEHDPSKVTVSEVTSLGLVQLTRKRTRESLERVLSESCPTCHGRGTIKSGETVCFELFREILRTARQFDAQSLMVVASPPIVQRLMEDDASSIAELEQSIGIPIRLQAESSYNQEQYDVVFL